MPNLPERKRLTRERAAELAAMPVEDLARQDPAELEELAVLVALSLRYQDMN